MERQFVADCPRCQQLQELKAEMRLGSLGGPESAPSPQKHHSLSLQQELDQYHLSATGAIGREDGENQRTWWTLIF